MKTPHRTADDPERCPCFECMIASEAFRGAELPPRPRPTVWQVAVDVLVWITCIIFAGAVAISYLLATL